MSVTLRNIAGTQAALGWAGGHAVVEDRSEGRPGGMGLGFNGGQMIALTIGGCFCNDLRHVGEKMGIAIEAIAVDVEIELEGDPIRVTRAQMRVAVVAPGADVAELLRRADEYTAVGNSVRAGFPLAIVPA